MTNNFLGLYFNRIQYSGTPKVDLETLRDLHLLHLQHIPYENINVFCHQAVNLDPETLTQKMLLRQRGGYCFEQNGLFLMALTELGFKCHANMARVHRNRPQPGGRTHQINLVELEGQIWLCDVGFGGSGFRHPLMMQSNVEVEQLGEIYRLHKDDVHGFYLQKKIEQEWYPLYTFKIEPALPIDMEMANFYTSNSSQHIFRDAIIGTKMTSQGRVTLSDHTFKCFNLTKGTLESETVTDFAAYLGNLHEHLGVLLNESEKALLKFRFATLKPPAS
ncbi:MAG TPA: arylamine N-acetyltransferase [Burkholderiales bacterium]|nr:arylamine N-acetyltransferase [Burkholderiales bacterium]